MLQVSVDGKPIENLRGILTVSGLGSFAVAAPAAAAVGTQPELVARSYVVIFLCVLAVVTVREIIGLLQRLEDLHVAKERTRDRFLKREALHEMRKKLLR